MRENSGLGKGKNNERDPTLEEHAESGKGPAQRSALFDQQPVDGEEAGDRMKDEDPSPAARDRGETASTDRAATTDR